MDLLLDAHREIPGEDWHGWGSRLAVRIREIATQHGRTERAKSLRGPAKDTSGMLRSNAGDTALVVDSPLEVETVHAVKGETHRTTVLYVPPDRVATWWSAKKAEERRIAFVAATRPTLALVVAVHSDDFAWLLNEQPQFVGAFADSGPIDDVLARLELATVPPEPPNGAPPSRPEADRT